MERDFDPNDTSDPRSPYYVPPAATPTTAAPRLTGPITGPQDPRLSDPSYGSDPEVIKFLTTIYGPTGTALTKPEGSPGWDPYALSWRPKPNDPETPGPGPTPGPTPTPIVAPGNVGGDGMPTSGFGAAPPPYLSDPNAPVYQPLPTYRAPEWTGGDYVAPTEAELYASPGYQARLDARLQANARHYAAQGTILNGGTVKALDRSAQDYATGEYQTLNANKYDQYKTRYAQFADAAGRDLASRSINAADANTTYANRTAAYAANNARTLGDYTTNLNTKRTSETDYWSRLMDLSGAGANLAGGSR